MGWGGVRVAGMRELLTGCSCGSQMPTTSCGAVNGCCCLPRLPNTTPKVCRPSLQPHTALSACVAVADCVQHGNCTECAVAEVPSMSDNVGVGPVASVEPFLTCKAECCCWVSLGLIDWHPYLPRLFSQLQWAFQVPVGTASATPPFGKLN